MGLYAKLFHRGIFHSLSFSSRVSLYASSNWTIYSNAINIPSCQDRFHRVLLRINTEPSTVAPLMAEAYEFLGAGRIGWGESCPRGAQKTRWSR